MKLAWFFPCFACGRCPLRTMRNDRRNARIIRSLGTRTCWRYITYLPRVLLDLSCEGYDLSLSSSRVPSCVKARPLLRDVFAVTVLVRRVARPRSTSRRTGLICIDFFDALRREAGVMLGEQSSSELDSSALRFWTGVLGRLAP